MRGGLSLGLEAVTKVFTTDAGPVRAIDGITFEVAAGSSLAITGRSGCGKSTLLALVGALERPTSGRVDIGARPVSGLGAQARARLRRAELGFVFQTDNLQPFLTALENVSLQLALSGRDDGSERALGLLRTLGLGAAAGKFPDQLSGGERQRVAVARALVHEPRLILADEPTGALDHANALVILELLRAAQAETGATLVVITHDPEVAAPLDRRVALSDGRVIADSAAAAEPVTAAGGAGA